MVARARASDVPLAAMYDRISPAVEDALVDTLKSFVRTVPAPRNDPFYGFDRRPGPTLRTLERLSAHGDFRKYVFVLDAGGGLGGVARWITLTYGCRVLVLDAVPHVVAAGQRLTSRARLLGRMTAVAGHVEAIPLRDATFTQIWGISALRHVTNRTRAFRELCRVLRPGSTLALYEIVRRSDSVPVIGGPWRHGTADEYLALLVEAGFTDVTCDDVTGDVHEPSAITRSFMEAFQRVLAERAPDEATAWRARADELERIDAIEHGADYRSLQFFARRPSV